MIEPFLKEQNYTGLCEKCGQGLGELVGVVTGPDRQDDTELYFYELCKKCTDLYNKHIEELTLKFTVEFFDISTPVLSQIYKCLENKQ